MNEAGYISEAGSGIRNWNDCERRAWCNGEFKNSFPDTLKPIFKQMEVIAANDGGTTQKVSEDTFTLLAEKELFGNNTWANANVEKRLFQLEYLKTAANRIKKVRGTPSNHWERSSTSDSQREFCYVNGNGSASTAFNYLAFGIAPICCI